METSTAVLFLPYLPPVSWFRQLTRFERVYLERWENYPKSTYRNRCEIAAANGKQILSLPLIGGRDHHQLYKDVRISYENDWQHIHWNSIRSAYGSAPFFEYYAEKFQIFYEKRYEFLFDYNLEILATVLPLLKMDKELPLTGQYENASEGFTDLRNAKTITSTYEPRYYQMFEDRYGFLPDLSIIDLLFNIGPRAGDWIKKPIPI